MRIGADTGWRALAVADDHTVALKDDGSVWAWGNARGWQGQPGTELQSTPVRIGDRADWPRLSAGKGHAMTWPGGFVR